ncbi:MAG: CotH kinase family protein [Muribaculaceae bacterium]|nr:CotH kinase family protein [Muribaculaceae bacterium]
MKNKLSLIIIALSLPFIGEAKLWINEIMQSNIDELYVENEFPDSWFEIYNEGGNAMRLVNYRVGDSKNFEKAYVLTATGIGADGHAVVYCDKVGKGNHTDFRIDSGKGDLYLFDPRGEIVDHISYPKMIAPNVAYGRTVDGGEEWGYELKPTPGEKNEGGVTSLLLPDPVFSMKGNVRYGDLSGQKIKVSIPEGVELPADTRLYITTDGSEPSIESPSYEKEHEFTVRQANTLIVRAKLISSEALSPRSVTHSYIFHPREVDLPVISLNTSDNYLYDVTVGIWRNYGEDWRRPLNVEYFPGPGSKQEINQVGEFRIHGGWSRAHPQKSLAVYANKRFGTKRYSYPFWNDKKEMEEVKSFILRNGGNCFDHQRINDSFVQTLFGINCKDIDWQAYQPVICYINGEYKGIYDLRERSNEDYVEANYDGLEDIDMIENWEELKAGSIDSFEELKKLYNNNPKYKEMEAAIDVENFVNLFVANAWATNTDFPGNNMVMWRPQKNDGKWRWIFKDMDFFASNPSDFNYFNFLFHTGSYSVGEGNADHAVKLFQVMNGFPEFREMLFDHFFVYMGDFLRPEVTSELLDAMREELREEYPFHIDCYSIWINMDGWNRELDDLKRWCEKRTSSLPDKLIKYYDLGRSTVINIIGGESGFSINEIPVNGDDFYGKWPMKRRMTLKSNDENSGWRLIYNNYKGIRQVFEAYSSEYEFTPEEGMNDIYIENISTLGVDKPKAQEENKVRITVAGELVAVESSQIITGISVYDITGRLIFKASPSSRDVKFESGGKGIYIVKVELADGSNVEKKLQL